MTEILYKFFTAPHARVFYPLLRLFLTVIVAARFAVLVSSNRRRNNKQPRAQTFQIQLKRPTVEASDKSHDNAQATEEKGEGRVKGCRERKVGSRRDIGRSYS